MPALVVEDFDAAEDLLDALGRRDARWGGRPLDWHFRGHAEASWGLLPASLRPDGSFRYGPRPGQIVRLAETHREQVMGEATVLAKFLEEMDRQGLPLPPGRFDEWKSFVRAAYRLATSREPWPHGEVRPVLALAQHHGVPTRLLDWTARPLVAAYFGARDAAERAARDAHESGRLAVWALNGLVFALFRVENLRGGLQIETVRPWRHANPNLRAQDGLFTVLVDEARRPDDPAAFPPLERAVADLGERADGEVQTFLRKMTLPVSEAGRLLRLLDQEGVSGTHLFPGVDGAVRGLRERGLWAD